MNNSYPISPFKGRNIVDLGFLCQQLVERVRTVVSLNVTILRLYLFYVTKNCFILPRKDLIMKSYWYSIWCGDQSKTQDTYTYTCVHKR